MLAFQFLFEVIISAFPSKRKKRKRNGEINKSDMELLVKHMTC